MKALSGLLFSLAYCCGISGEVTKMPVSITLSSNDSVVSSGQSWAALHLEIRNVSDRSLLITKRTSVTSVDSGLYYWTVQIVFSDSVRMFFPENHFDKARIPARADYTELKPNEGLSFRFEVDFKSLFANIDHVGSVNTNYGEYRVKVRYAEPFDSVKKSLRGEFHSNEIILNFRK